MPEQSAPRSKTARQRRRPHLLVDGLLGVVVAWVLWVTAQFTQMWVGGPPPWMHEGRVGRPPWMSDLTPVWGVLPFAVLSGVGVTLRRRASRAGYVLVVAGAVGYLALQNPVPPALLGLVLGVHALAGRLPLRRWPGYAALLLALPVAELVGEPVLGPTDPGWYGGVLLGASVLVVAALVALLRRNRRDADRVQRDEELRRAAYTERLRVAREVHDIVGHSLSVISMQAGVALHVLEARPEQARVSLEAIRHSSRDALAELRQALGVFREESTDGPRAPAPGLERVDDLAAALRGAGRSVTVHRKIPAEAAIPAGLQQTAFRVVQEALTNVVRHTDAAAATVELRAERDQLIIEVSDDGPVLPGPVIEGNGLHGMRERVASAGGTLDIRGGPSGGVQIRARLPLPVDHDKAPGPEPYEERR